MEARYDTRVLGGESKDVTGVIFVQVKRQLQHTARRSSSTERGGIKQQITGVREKPAVNGNAMRLILYRETGASPPATAPPCKTIK